LSHVFVTGLCLFCQGQRRETKTKDKDFELQGDVWDKLMDTLGCAAGWLVVFDRAPGKSWDDKIFCRSAAAPSGKPITIFGC
jgi:hypothetical protein